ncbi:acidic endochitinase WIN6.2B-like [Octopus sinensis]|uniref:Acidic endochitinase WIN6.2B-like n=1 Tax=Octopus sinensis TaxID=2607531 RepID=A0A6P7TSR8_9MOLL|nr:acidic endochitinase WIN6.2B-like [Octopus sinensis]
MMNGSDCYDDGGGGNSAAAAGDECGDENGSEDDDGSDGGGGGGGGGGGNGDNTAIDHTAETSEAVNNFDILSCVRDSCRHPQIIFAGLQLFVKSASPDGSVGCEILPGIGVDAKYLHVPPAHVPVPQLRAANVWDPTILHTANVAKPAQPTLS